MLECHGNIHSGIPFEELLCREREKSLGIQFVGQILVLVPTVCVLTLFCLSFLNGKMGTKACICISQVLAENKL